jgi:hypothetical protein
MKNKNCPVSAFSTNVISFEITEFIPYVVSTLHKPYTPILKYNRSRSENYRRGVRRRSIRTLCPCRAILQASLGLGFLNHKPDLN